MADQNIPQFEETQPVDDVPKFEETTDVASAGAPASGMSDEPSHPTPQYSPLDTALMHGASGATMGFSDEIEGALKAAGEKGMNIIKGEDHKDLVALYKKYRDQRRQALKDSAEQNPKTALASQIGGGVATSFIPGLGEANLAKMTALGALSGLGNSNADLTTGRPQDFLSAAEDTGIGGVTGYVGGRIGQAASNFLNPAERAETGGLQIAKSMGLTPKAATRTVRAISPDKVSEIGQTAYNEGASPLLGGAQKILEKTGEAIDANEEKLNPLFQKAQQDLDQNLPQALEKTGPISDKVVKYYQDFVSRLGNTDQDEAMAERLLQNNVGNMNKLAQRDGNLQALNAFKKDLQNLARAKNAYNNPLRDETEAGFLKGMAGIVRQHIEDLADASGSGYGQAIKQTNGTLSNLYQYEDAAGKMFNASQRAPVFTTGDAIATVGAAAAKSPLLAAGEAAKKGVEVATGKGIIKAGQQALGKTNMVLSKGLDKVGETGQKVLQSGANKIANKAVTSPFTEQVVQQHIPHLDTAYSLYNADDDTLREVSASLKSNKTTENAGLALDKYLQSGDQSDKARALFLIQQNDNAMKALRGEE